MGFAGCNSVCTCVGKSDVDVCVCTCSNHHKCSKLYITVPRVYHVLLKVHMNVGKQWTELYIICSALENPILL